MMLGWIGNVFIIIGIVLIAYRLRLGFIASCVGNTLWLAKAVATNQYDLTTIQVIIVSLQIFSWWKWRNVGPTDSICSRTDSD